MFSLICPHIYLFLDDFLTNVNISTLKRMSEINSPSCLLCEVLLFVLFVSPIASHKENRISILFSSSFCGFCAISLANAMSSGLSWLNSRNSDRSSNSRIHWKQQGTRHKRPGFESLFCHFLAEWLWDKLYILLWPQI